MLYVRRGLPHAGGTATEHKAWKQGMEREAPSPNCAAIPKVRLSGFSVCMLTCLGACPSLCSTQM